MCLIFLLFSFICLFSPTQQHEWSHPLRSDGRLTMAADERIVKVKEGGTAAVTHSVTQGSCGGSGARTSSTHLVSYNKPELHVCLSLVTKKLKSILAPPSSLLPGLDRGSEVSSESSWSRNRAVLAVNHKSEWLSWSPSLLDV